MDNKQLNTELVAATLRRLAKPGTEEKLAPGQRNDELNVPPNNQPSNPII